MKIRAFASNSMTVPLQLDMTPFGSWKKEGIYANAYEKIKKFFLDILPHEVSIPLFSFTLLSVLTTPPKKTELDFSRLISLSGGTKEDREFVALYYCDVINRGNAWSIQKLPDRHSTNEPKERLQEKAQKMKDCVLILSEYDNAMQVAMIKNMYENNQGFNSPKGMGLLLLKNKPKNQFLYNIDISNVDLSKLKKHVLLTQDIELVSYLTAFIYSVLDNWNDADEVECIDFVCSALQKR